MNRNNFTSGVTIGSTLGITLALLWVLSNFLADFPTVHAADLLVCPSGCTYSSIQDAVDNASSGDVIKVATAVYADVSVRPRRDLDSTGLVTQVVYINKTVTIRGGYTTAFTEPPDPDANPTTLDAKGRGRAIYITGDINPTIEGLRLIGGDAAGLGGAPFSDPAGGGLYAISATLMLVNNTIFSNTADLGGGLYAIFSTGTINANTFISNTTFNMFSGGGAGLYLESSSIALAKNVVVSNTTTRHGGGLYLSSVTAELSTNSIMSNTARNNGGGLHMIGVRATVIANTFSGNIGINDFTGSDDGGGGMFVKFGTITVSGNTFISNTATKFGGGLRVNESDGTIKGNTFISNSAPLGGGGGVSLLSSDILLDANSFFANNGEEGGAISAFFGNYTVTNNIVADNEAGASGGGLVIGFTSSRLTHNTFARNRADDGSGVFVSFATVTMTNNIVVSHTVGITVASPATAKLEGTLWGSGAWANTVDTAGSGTIISGTGNIFGDPDFVDPDGNDYHIGASSAALDAGVISSITRDIDVQPRPMGDYDIGADEYWPPGTLTEIYLPIVLH